VAQQLALRRWKTESNLFFFNKKKIASRQKRAMDREAPADCLNALAISPGASCTSESTY